jgi:glycerophosphoryl diester phosphodiesterase
MKKNIIFISSKRIALFCFVLSWSFLLYSQVPCNRLHVIKTKNSKDLQNFFSYSPDMIPFISAHRGGADIGFPENCIPTFTNTLCYVHSILEVDTRQTKDGKIVMMHDATIDRTTTGSGKVSDYTLEELYQFTLKDLNGTPTAYKIPTFDEVLDWADGKTILLIDRKSVPMEVIIDKISEHNALHRILFMAYNHEEAKKYHQLQPEAVMEVFVKDKKRIGKSNEYRNTGQKHGCFY